MKLLVFLPALATAFIVQQPSLLRRSGSVPLLFVQTPLFVDETRNNIKEYYGEKLQTSDDLLTSACCTATAPPAHIQQCILNLHPQTVSRYYGCGLCLPDYDLTGLSILDLGCGAGRDVYIASQLVGPTGRVIGVDMTKEQLEAARKFQDYHAEKFGYSNVEFVQGYLEQLDELDLGSFDLIVSNCVLNLCTDKAAVLSHCHNLLKDNGEFYFSDVYTNRRVPLDSQQDPVLYGECLSGALYWNDFINLAKDSGFMDSRLVEDSAITIRNAAVQEKVEQSGLRFWSATYRLWKSNALEHSCEDYGQAVIYKGSIPRAAGSWKLDKGHVFETGRVYPVCGNTWYMLQSPAVAPHFEFLGTFDTHYGIFEGCGDKKSLPFSEGTLKSATGSQLSCC